MKKLVLFIITLFLVFMLFVIITFIPKNYNYNYDINNINITEKFDKTKKVYTFAFSSDDNTFEYAISHKYIRTRGLIRSLSLNDNCLTIKSKYFEEITLCKNEENNYITSYYDKEFDNNKLSTYEKIDIYNLNNKKYYIWNYYDLLFISDKKNEKINLFKTDLYQLNIVYELNNYLVIADYNEKYTFNKFYLINSKNNKVKEVTLNQKLSMNSYILGNYKKNIYLYDPEAEKEFKINLFKETISKNNYEILVNNSWEKTSVNKLNKMNVSFYNDNDFEFVLEDSNLYYKTPVSKILITNLKVERIIKQIDSEVYFISDDSLYYASLSKDIIKLMTYSEWKFNNKNIYIF